MVRAYSIKSINGQTIKQTKQYNTVVILSHLSKKGQIHFVIILKDCTCLGRISYFSDLNEYVYCIPNLHTHNHNDIDMDIEGVWLYDLKIMQQQFNVIGNLDEGGKLAVVWQ